MCSVRENLESVYKLEEGSSEREAGFYKGRFVKYSIWHKLILTAKGTTDLYGCSITLYFLNPKKIPAHSKFFYYLTTMFKLSDDKVEYNFFGIANKKSLKRKLDKLFLVSDKIEKVFQSYNQAEIVDRYKSGEIDLIPSVNEKPVAVNDKNLKQMKFLD